MHARQHHRCAVKQRTSREAAGLTRTGIRQPATRQRRVRDGDAVDPLCRELHDDSTELVLGNIGRQLDDDRPPHFSGIDLFGARVEQTRQQLLERGGILQVAQARRVRRGDVDREVAGDVVECLQSAHVVGDAVRRFLVGADVDADDAGPGASLQSGERRLMTAVVEAEPVDDRAVARQAEHARARIARLRQRRHRADLGKAAAELQDGVGHPRVLVETGSNTNGVGQRQPGEVDPQRRVIGYGSGGKNAQLQAI